MIKKARMFLGYFIYVITTIIIIFEFIQALFLFSDSYVIIYNFKVFFGVLSFLFLFVLEFLVVLPISKKYNYESGELRNFFSVKQYIKQSEKIVFLIISTIAIFSFIVIYKKENKIVNELYYFGLISGPLSQYVRLSFLWLRRKMGNL